jgi:hypothetical protein
MKAAGTKGKLMLPGCKNREPENCCLSFRLRQVFSGEVRGLRRISPVEDPTDPRFFVNSADPHRVLFFAIMATPQVPPIAFASLRIFHVFALGAFMIGHSPRISRYLTKSVITH